LVIDVAICNSTLIRPTLIHSTLIRPTLISVS
jgi:hypothetical protein